MHPKNNTLKIVSICLTILFLGLLNTSIASAENYKFVTEWGYHGYGEGEFGYPVAIAADSSGNVYVIDSYDSSGPMGIWGGYYERIEKFDTNGKFLTEWGSSGAEDGQFNGASGIGVDTSGNVYVMDTQNWRVQKFDSDGNFRTKWQAIGDNHVFMLWDTGFAVDSLSNIYIANNATGQIEKYDSNGILIAQWGSRGTGDGQFMTVSGIAVDASGNVYVADNTNHRIEKFDSNGKFITQWGSPGFGDGQFVDITGIAVDSSGNVYVSQDVIVSSYQYLETKIQKFDSNGTFITKWGSWGSGEGNISYPAGVAVDSSGNVYVLDSTNHRISKFAPENSNIFYPGINWMEGDKFYKNIADELNASMMDSYKGTDMFSGALQVYLASKTPPIETETNFLANNSDTGTYNIAFAHSGGTRTLVSKIESGKVKANYVVLAAPALITQEELQKLITDYGVKKVVVFQSDRDILNLLHVTLDPSYTFNRNNDNSYVAPAMMVELDNLPLGVLFNKYIFIFLVSNSTILKHIDENPVEDANHFRQQSNLQTDVEMVRVNDRHYVVININPFLTQADQDLNVIEQGTFWIGGADRENARLFANWSKNNNMNNDIIVVNVNKNRNPMKMHKRLCTTMADNYSNSTYPFDGSIPGLKGLK